MKQCYRLASVAAVTLGFLAPTAAQAQLPGYTVKSFLKATGPFADFSLFQMGDCNNRGQVTWNMIGGGGEKQYIYDPEIGVRKISDADIKLADGANFSIGNVWSPQGLNNNGVVAWAADMENGTGARYIVTYEIASGKYEIIARAGTPAPGGGTLADTGIAPSGRMLADINDQGVVVWNQGIVEEDSGAVFRFDPATREYSVIAKKGMKTTDGKTITNAWWPDINNNGQITFCANVDNSDSYGIYQSDGRGNISPIVPAGATIDGVTIGSARWARNNNRGDVVCVVDTAGDQGGAGEGTDDTGVVLYTAADGKLRMILKPGTDLPGGGKYAGQEPRRRTVGITDAGMVVSVCIRDDEGGAVVAWDATNGLRSVLRSGDTLQLEAATTVTAVGRDVNGWDGYLIGVSGNGHIAFSAQIDGVGHYLLFMPPAQ